MLLLFLSGTGALLSQLDWFHAAGSALFLGASLLQHQSMVLLASLRVGESGEISRSSLRKTSCLLVTQYFYNEINYRIFLFVCFE